MTIVRILSIALSLCITSLIFAGCPPTTEEPVEPATVAEPDTAAEPVSEATVAAPYEGDDAAFFTINSKPWSTMTIDGVPHGNTPKKNRAIAPGEHTVVLDCGACEVPQVKTLKFTVTAGETYTSVLNAFDPPYTSGLETLPSPDEIGLDSDLLPDGNTAYITINAKPWSTIWLDGTLLGNTPKKKVEIPAGEHTVLLKCGPCPKPQEKELRFTVAAGETYTSILNAFEE